MTRDSLADYEIGRVSIEDARAMAEVQHEQHGLGIVRVAFYWLLVLFCGILAGWALAAIIRS